MKTVSTTTPALMLYDIIRKLPEGAEVEFSEESGSGKMIVKAGRSRFNLLTLPPENFPVLEDTELPINFTVTSKEFFDLIDKVKFAVSTEETRYYLNGVYVHAIAEKQPVLRAAATDGHRLAHNSLRLPEGATGMSGIIIPKKTVGEIRKLLAENENDIKVSMSDSKIKLDLPDISMTSKLIDGQYPDYNRVIPAGNDKVMTVNTEAFLAAVDRVSTVSLEKARAVKISLDANKLTLEANSPDGSTATEELEVEYAADSFEIGFNFRYLMDMLAQIEGDTVQFVLADSGSPALVRDSANTNVLYVLMPMRV